MKRSRFSIGPIGPWTISGAPALQVPSFMEDSQLPRSDFVSQNVSSLRRAASVPVIRRNRHDAGGSWDHGDFRKMDFLEKNTRKMAPPKNFRNDGG